jgi:hypothetical protein
MTRSRSRNALHGLAGLALGAMLIASAGVGTVLGAKSTPAITGVSCTTAAYESDPTVRYTSVSWQGLHPSRVEFYWHDQIGSYGATFERPKGSRLQVATPTVQNPSYTIGIVTVYGPHGIKLESDFLCVQGY